MSEFERAISTALFDGEKDRLKNAISCYLNISQGKLPADESGLEEALKVMTSSRPKEFDELTFSEYTRLWLASERWDRFSKTIKLEKAAIQRLFDKVRVIRNKIAHFRGDVSRAEHDTLIKYRDWLQAHQGRLLEQAGETEEHIEATLKEQESHIQAAVDSTPQPGFGGDWPTEKQQLLTPHSSLDLDNASKYSALARWLRGVPYDVSTTWTTFDKIETLIGQKLPPSALKHRSWWANDLTSHLHSKLWLEAGWMTDIIDLDNRRVRFRRRADSSNASP